MKDNCAVCIHHNVFWGGSGCNLLNNNEKCKFEATKLHEQAKGNERAIHILKYYKQKEARAK